MLNIFLIHQHLCPKYSNCSMSVTKTVSQRYSRLSKVTPKLFLLSSTNFYHTTCFESALCRPCSEFLKLTKSLRWRHNDHAGVSNHQPPGCLLNRLFRRKSKKTSKLRVTGLCAGNSPGTGEFSAQMASYAENVSIWWRHHVNALHV